MKKQFFRVKQLADQTFLRADKSEVLNHEELQIADQKVEYLRGAISAILKRIPTNSGQGNDIEKRAKKCVENHLAAVFNEQGQRKAEQASTEEECQLFQHILRDCGHIEQNLAREYAEHEIKVEEMVSTPLQMLMDNEFPNILKHKRNLSKYILDKDSASNRYHSTKKEALKDDMEEADSKVEQSRDVLAYEMFGLLARENELSSYILQLLKLQRGYHESALKNLEGIIPELEKKIGDSSVKRVFGTSLQEHLRVTGKKIAYPLEICVSVLSKIGLSEEGLLRIAGGMSRVKRLKSSIDSGCLTCLIPEYQDVHVLASTLKLYLRELPEPLLTFHLHNEWMQSMQHPEPQRLDIVKKILSKLPPENIDNLSYLMNFLARLSHHPENKMSSSNIAIVMAPNLLWDKNEETNMNMGNCATINMLVELFIKEVDVLFPDDVSKFVNLPLALVQEDDAYSRSSFRVESAELGASSESVQESPKPNSRKKKPAAPIPPNNIMSRSEHDPDISSERGYYASSYPSGSSTLNRTKKASKETPNKAKNSIGINTDENSLSLSRKVAQNPDAHAKIAELELPKVDNLVNLDDSKTEQKTHPPNPINNPKAKPIANCDNKNFKTTVTHQIGQFDGAKPIAAPRTCAQDGEKVNLARNASLKSDACADVQLRRFDALERAAKPEVPARPASLQKRASVDVNIDPAALHRTQCSVYSVANKQQPSIVNIQNKYQPGHDNQITEKERFLGHLPDGTSRIAVVPLPRTSLENKQASDINSNNSNNDNTKCNKPGLPPKSLNLKSNEHLNLMKSNERLNVAKCCESNEKFNGNPQKSGHGHVRTRSDGNIIDLTSDNSLLQTPPSPRSLNKPTQPPPPPPVINVTITNNVKVEQDSTNL